MHKVHENQIQNALIVYLEIDLIGIIIKLKIVMMNLRA